MKLKTKRTKKPEKSWPYFKGEKIKIVHIITKLELGGAQLNTIYTFKNLDKKKFNAYLLSGDGGLLNDQVIKKKSFIIIKSLVRSIHPFKDIIALYKIKSILKKIQPHIVHTHSSKAGIIGRIAAFLQKTPIIIHTVHGFSFSPIQSFIKRNFYIWAEKKVSKKTTHFIFVSKDDIKTATRINLIKNNYSLIRSGFEIEKYIPKQNNYKKIRQKFNIKMDDFVCGTIAPFKPQKGLFNLIEIAVNVIKKEKNVVFFIAGDGKLKKKFMSVINKKNVSKHFRLPGFIFPVDSAIDIFDCGISTSLWEGLPQSIVQMRLKKKPVIASDISGNAEIIKDNLNGFLVKVGDNKTFSEKIQFLIKNKSERNRLGQYNDDFVDWDANMMVQKQEKLYYKLKKAKI